MKNEFDSLLQQEYDKGEFEYNPAQWDRMAAALSAEEKPAAKKRVWFWLPVTAFAASLCLFVVLTVNRHPVNTQLLTHSNKQNTPAQHAPGIAPTLVPGNDGTTPGNTTAPQQTAAVKDNTAIAAYAQPNEIIKPVVNTQVVPNAENKTDIVKIVDIAHVPDNKPKVHINLIDPVFQEPAAKKNTSLSLAGGVNYGSLNTGYTLGVNARRQLNDQFYVEGDLAVVNNAASFGSTGSAATTTTVNTNGKGNGIMGMAGFDWHPANLGSGEDQTKAYAIASTTAQSTSTPGNLFYVQVTPSVGYHISRSIALSVGADVQRLLKSDEKAVTAFDANNEEKLVPGFDFGLMGKTEVALSKKLKAGFQYRKGLNDMIKSSNQYLDRSYMQVQLKFIILNK